MYYLPFQCIVNQNKHSLTPNVQVASIPTLVDFFGCLKAKNTEKCRESDAHTRTHILLVGDSQCINTNTHISVETTSNHNFLYCLSAYSPRVLIIVTKSAGVEVDVLFLIKNPDAACT